MHPPATDHAHRTHRGKLEMSTGSIDHAVHGTAAPPTMNAHILTSAGVSKVHLEDNSEEPAHRHQYQNQLKRPLRMMSSAGPPAKDITADFTAAASSMPYMSGFLHPPANDYSFGDRAACQGCLLHTLRVCRCTRGTIARSVEGGVRSDD